jgi:hypothetical protein
MKPVAMSLPILSVYIRALAKELGLVDTSHLIHRLLPEIHSLGEYAGFQEYRIKMSRAANTLAAIMCADTNASFHTGTGVLQTLTLVGMCSAVTSQFRPGYALAKIQPDITFRSAVPIEAAVIMGIKELKARGNISVVELRGRVEQTGHIVFTPRTLTMIKI